MFSPIDGNRLPFRSCRNPRSSLYLDLDALGWVEYELLVQGDGFATRILVRRPASRDAFSGAVVVEPLHVLDEECAMWSHAHRHLVRRGHAWIGVTVATGAWAPRDVAPTGGIRRLVKEDPERYAALHLDELDGDDPYARMGQPSAQAHAVLAAVAAGAREGSVLGWPARRVHGAGWSQTGLVLAHHLDRAYAAGTFDTVLVAVAPGPQRVPDGIALAHLLSEAELVGTLGSPSRALDDLDAPMVRGYEVPGTHHFWEPKPRRKEERDAAHAARHNDRPWSLLVHALVDHLDRWAVDGTPLPRAPRVVREADGTIARDELGNARGGVRSPWLDVPDATYLARCACSPAVGALDPLDDDALDHRYGCRADYRAAFGRRRDELVTEGWLLAEDAPLLVPPR